MATKNPLIVDAKAPASDKRPESLGIVTPSGKAVMVHFAQDVSARYGNRSGALAGGVARRKRESFVQLTDLRQMVFGHALFSGEGTANAGAAGSFVKTRCPYRSQSNRTI